MAIQFDARTSPAFKCVGSPFTMLLRYRVFTQSSWISLSWAIAVYVRGTSRLLAETQPSGLRPVLAKEVLRRTFGKQAVSGTEEE